MDKRLKIGVVATVVFSLAFGMFLAYNAVPSEAANTEATEEITTDLVSATTEKVLQNISAAEETTAATTTEAPAKTVKKVAETNSIAEQEKAKALKMMADAKKKAESDAKAKEAAVQGATRVQDPPATTEAVAEVAPTTEATTTEATTDNVDVTTTEQVTEETSEEQQPAEDTTEATEETTTEEMKIVEVDDTPAYYSDSDIVMMAQLIDIEAGAVSPLNRRAAVAWTVLNRIDNGTYGSGQTIYSIITMPYQYAWWSSRGYSDTNYAIAADVLARWANEKATGTTDPGRVLPKNYQNFYGDGWQNHFYDNAGNYWDYSLPGYDPYEGW